MTGVNKILIPNITEHMLYNTISKSGTYGVTNWDINGTFEDQIVVPWTYWGTLNFSLSSDNSWGNYYGLKAKNISTGADTWICRCYSGWDTAAGGPHSIIGQYDLYGYGTINGVTMANRSWTIQVDPTDGIIKWSTPQGLKPLSGLKYSDYTDFYLFVTNNIGNNYNYGVTTINVSSTYTEKSFSVIVDEYTSGILEYCSQYTYDNNKSITNNITSVSDYLSKCVTAGIITSQQFTDCKIYSTDFDYMNTVINENTGVMTYNSPIAITPTLVNPNLNPYYMIIMKKKLTPYTTSNNTVVNLPQYLKLKIGGKNDSTADIKLDYINRIDTIDALKISIKHSNIIN